MKLVEDSTAVAYLQASRRKSFSNIGAVLGVCIPVSLVVSFLLFRYENEDRLAWKLALIVPNLLIGFIYLITQKTKIPPAEWKLEGGILHFSGRESGKVRLRKKTVPRMVPVQGLEGYYYLQFGGRFIVLNVENYPSSKILDEIEMQKNIL